MDPPRKKILIVDDEELVLLTHKRHVTRAGFDVALAHSGPEALQKIRDEVPDLVLLDIIMPQMSGFEVCRRLRADERTRHIPIIMVTGLAATADSEECMMDGASAVLTKPVDAKELIAKILSFLNSPFK